ncbi:PmbA protein [Methylomarinovum caldicuralii]|uniref:PmbA protein n=1 Tax=Methylomarinovum caldicuralii TaxID=438856 RepID=A0AAU9CLJ9_9GAMM|nr:metalloprotease PmbA [Methylomarinovum caldicuralii]BCX82546.1 PmbA protein [Methylomarinovum caldicuralii]
METLEAQLAPLQDTVAQVLELARRLGASGAEAGAGLSQGLAVSARMGEVETVEHHRDQSLGVTVYFGQRKGSAATSDLSPDSLRETVEAACAIARHASEDPYAGLPDPEWLARDIPDLDLDHPWPITADEAIELTVACERVALESHAEIVNSEGASLHTHRGIRVLGNTLGFLHGYPASRHSLSCAVVGKRGEQMQRDYWYTVARDPADLESPEAVGRQAAERTVARLGARPLSTRQCPVVYAAEVATGLVGHFLAAIRGGNLYRKASFLVDSLGKPVFPDFVHIHEAPHIPKGIGSAPYDNEGVATYAHDLIREGVVASYILDSYSARKLGLRSTGNAGGVHNVSVDSGSLDRSALLREMGTGLLVTELMGHGINLVTGDYSRGAAGFWVENGEIQYPVEEITIAGNLRDMFRQIEAIGCDVDRRGNIRTGSIWLKQMTVAGS